VPTHSTKRLIATKLLHPSNFLLSMPFWLQRIDHFRCLSGYIPWSIHICSPYQLSSAYPVVITRRVRFSRFVPRINTSCFASLSGSLFIQIPRFIQWHGWSFILLFKSKDNSLWRLRVARMNLHKRRNFPFATLNHLQSQYPSQIKEGFVCSFLSKIELAMQINMTR